MSTAKVHCRHRVGTRRENNNEPASPRTQGSHDYGLRCKAPRENQSTQLGLRSMKPTVLFEMKDEKTEKVKVAQSSPEIRIKKPIPLTFDDSPIPNAILETSPKKGCSRLDLPNVFHVLKSSNFKGQSCLQIDKILSKRCAPAETRFSDTPSALENMMNGFSLSESTVVYMHCAYTDHLDLQMDGIATKSRISNKCSTCEQSSSSPFMTSSPSGELSLSGENIRKLVGGGVEVDTWKRLSGFAMLAIKMDPSDSENMFSFKNVPTTMVTQKAAVKRILSALNLDITKLKQFQLYPDTSICHSHRYYLCHNTFPDTMKHFAFFNWQKGDLDKCVYYLSQSQGSFLRTEILDKHNYYFCRPDEYMPSSIKVDQKLETIKLQKFHQQSKDLVEFGKSLTSFYEHLDKLDPDWNIIQVTSMFPVHNRFSSSIAAEPETPGLFLTCFSNIPGSKKKQPFVTYIPEPQLELGVSKTGILAEFKKVMLKNRALNEKYVGDRKSYWTVRDEHNSHLKNVVNAVEENWLSPWHFLLPGNVIDVQIRQKIHSFIRSVEIALNKKLTGFQKVAFYKLVENYCVLNDEMSRVLPTLISYILDCSKERLANITRKLIQIGSTVDESTARHPTILVLDQGIEQLPWDWLPCLRSTTVTRVQSLSILYSMMNLVKTISPVNPSQCTFVLNPDLSLKSVQTRLEKYFKSRSTWTGFVGTKPSFQDFDMALQNKDLFLYCGHGSGQCLFPEYLLQKIYCRAIPVLMGCGSAQYKYLGPRSFSPSVVNSYCVAACPSVVGFLWEITDVECDRITVELLERWTPGNCPIPAMTSFDNVSVRDIVPCLATAVRLSRKGATQFLTAASIVNYGLPIQRIC